MKHQESIKYPGTPAVLDARAAAACCSPEMPPAATEPMAVSAGRALTGMRAGHVSNGLQGTQGVLSADIAQRLTYVLSVAQPGDDHAVDNASLFQLAAKNVQAICDLNLIARRIAETALTPGIVVQDLSPTLESVRLPEPELCAEYIGKAEDLIETPTAAQRILFGAKRRRVPALWDIDNPALSGPALGAEAAMRSVSAQRPFFYGHVREIADQAMQAFHALTGRKYQRVSTYHADDAEYLIVAQGGIVCLAEAVADYLRKTKRIKAGVIDLTMFRPFPGDLIGRLVQGRKGVAVLERTDQPMAEDLPIIRELRACVAKCIENGQAKGALPYPGYAAYARPQDLPALFSGVYGLGGREVWPEAVLGAVENMIDGGARKRFYYLSSDFAKGKALTPQREVHQDALLEAYPFLTDLSVRGSENPPLLPERSISVRVHAVGGRDEVAGHLALSLFDVFGLHLQARLKNPGARKDRPSATLLTVAPEPLRVSGEYMGVDVALCSDPEVFRHGNPLANLKSGGVVLLQSASEDAQAVWGMLPLRAQKDIVQNNLHVYFVDAIKIARETASTPERRALMHDMALQGAFYQVSPVMNLTGTTEAALFRLFGEHLHGKIGDEEMKSLRRGYDDVKEVVDKPLGAEAPEPLRRATSLPSMLKRQPVGEVAATDPHRFWEQVGDFYRSGDVPEGLAGPIAALNLVPPATGLFRDLTPTRATHPAWIPERCTACGRCYVVCPDNAIHGLVNPLIDVFETAIRRIEQSGRTIEHLRGAVRTLERKLRPMLSPAADFKALLAQAIQESVAAAGGDAALQAEFDALRQELDAFVFAVTEPHFSEREKAAKGTGALFSISINPYACKGCMACVEACPETSLKEVPQSEQGIERLQKTWGFWLDLPNTPAEHLVPTTTLGDLETLLLDKQNTDPAVFGGNACAGCGEALVLRLFTACVESLMQPRVKRHVACLETLIGRLEQHIRLKLAGNLDLSDTEAVQSVLSESDRADVTLSALSRRLDNKPLDADWVNWVTGVLASLKQLKWQYVEGAGKRGRARLGVVNASECPALSGAAYPYNPYPFPWVNHLSSDAVALAEGVLDGHMAKMAEGFKYIRMAELELAGDYRPDKHDEFFAAFDWRQFTDEEYQLCPPVVCTSDAGTHEFLTLLRSGKPIKVLLLDTHARSCEQEAALSAMALRSAYVLQGAIHHPSHLAEGFIEGLNTRRPALFNVACPCSNEHGMTDASSKEQSRLAVESRAHPLLRYNPDLAPSVDGRLSIEGNPAPQEDWPVYRIEYLDEQEQPASREFPLTFADFAVTQERFNRHFVEAPPGDGSGKLVSLAGYLQLDAEDREGLYPFVWAVDADRHLRRLIPSASLVQQTAARRDAWRTIRNLVSPAAVPAAETAAIDEAPVPAAPLEAAADVSAPEPAPAAVVAPAPAAPVAAAEAAPGSGPSIPDDGSYVAPWIDSEKCSTCEECVKINPEIFAYDARRKAFIKDPHAGPYKHLVRAAEKCTEKVIHPGYPADRTEKGIEKQIEKAKKFM